MIIPTFCERDNLIPLINSVHDFLPASDILVIDDNSPDGTGEIAALRASRDSKVHVLHRTNKEGLGKAYIAGFCWALDRHYSHIIQMDADFSHAPALLPILLEAAKSHDVALGSRWVSGGSVQGWPYHRKFLSQTANLYAKVVLGLSIHDLTGGFKCLSRKVLEEIDLTKVVSAGYGFQIEITWLATRLGFSVIEVPIIFSERAAGKSKLSNSTIVEALLLVWKLRRGR